MKIPTDVLATWSFQDWAAVRLLHDLTTESFHSKLLVHTR